MTSPINLDSLHAAWQVLDQRMERQDGLLLEQARRTSVDALRRRLRPLAWGQLTQILLGIALLAIAVPVWSTYRDMPHVLVSGLILHAYAVATIMLGGVTLGALSRLQYGTPVIELQVRLARLRRLYVIGSTGLGLAWWLLWMPFAVVAFAWMGVDFVPRVAPALPWMVGSGMVGLAATWLFDRWARRRPALHARLRRAMAGASLVAANAELDALRELERGDADADAAGTRATGHW